MANGWTPVPDWSTWDNQGGGLAVADVSGTGTPDLVVFFIDNPAGQNGGYYRVGSDLGTDGLVAGGWGPWQAVPDWHFWENQGGDVALADLSGNGMADLVVFTVDNPAGQNGGWYRVGHDLDADGRATGGWGPWHEVPGWHFWENQGAGLALADLSGNGMADLVVFTVDNPAGQNGGWYRVGRDLDTDGNVTGGWGDWQTVPDWYFWESQDAGIALSDLDGDGRPELVVFHVDNPPGQNGGWYQVGWGIGHDGSTVDGWSPWVQVGDWPSWENEGAGIALVPLPGPRPSLLVFEIDAPAGQNQGAYRAFDLVLDIDEAPARGAWRLLAFDSQVLAVHAALLHTDEVLFFAGTGNDPTHVPPHDYRTSCWRLPGPDVTRPATPADLFCAGQSLLPDGRVLAAGGTLQYDPFRGLRDAYVYDPAHGQWTVTAAMGGGRWYPTLVTLADGNVLTVSGLGEDGNLNAAPEVYDWQAGHWHALPPSGNWPMYAQLYLLADGRVFYAGAQMGGNNGMLPAVIDFPAAHVDAVHGLSDPDLRNQGASVLLPPAQDQRVLIVGGGPADPHNMAMATGEACVVSLAQPHPVYQHAAPLHFPRMHLNAVVLPDRTVVVCGGADRQEMTAEASFHAEIYDPVADAWAVGAAARVARVYHSIAILLPDGRVATAGSNPDRGMDELRIEMYLPPYLFRGDRPAIFDAPAQLAYGQPAEVRSPQAAEVRWVSLVRPSTTTHSCNAEQRLVDVPFSIGPTGALELDVPVNRNLAPPGWYLLFLTDERGVPSVGRWTHLA